MKKLRMFKSDAPGILITFCGLDGCGKTTMIQYLDNNLNNRGFRTVRTKQPTSMVRESGIFRTFMDNPDHSNYEYRSLSLLAASDRIQHTNKVIIPYLREGYIVISDRYYYSCLANLIARGYDQDTWIYEVSEAIVKPDISFFLDLPVETAISRVRNRAEERNRYIDIDLQYRLRKAYIEMCEKNHCILVPSDIDRDTTSKIILSNVNRVLEKKYGD